MGFVMTIGKKKKHVDSIFRAILPPIYRNIPYVYGVVTETAASAETKYI